MAKFTNKQAGITAVIASVLAVGAIGATIGLAAKVADQETTKVLSGSAYTIGLLDDTTGKLPTEDSEKDLSGISTTNYYDLEGLKIEVAQDAEVKYQVDYYDADKQFIAVQTWTGDFVAEDIMTMETEAVYVKIEIIPLDDADGTVNIFEKSGYANLLTVTVNK